MSCAINTRIKVMVGLVNRGCQLHCCHQIFKKIGPMGTDSNMQPFVAYLSSVICLFYYRPSPCAKLGMQQMTKSAVKCDKVWKSSQMRLNWVDKSQILQKDVFCGQHLISWKMSMP